MSRRQWFFLLVLSILCLGVALLLLVAAGHFLHANFNHLPPLPDLGHRILPRWDVLFLYRVGLWTSIFLYICGAINERRRAPYFFFMGSFWFLVRIASTTITPLGAPADILEEYAKKFVVDSFWDWLASGTDAPTVLFFSGHTGLPFLGYLLFRKSIRIGVFALPMILATGHYLFSASAGSYPLWLGGVLAGIWFIVLAFRNVLIRLDAVFLIWSFIMAVTVLFTRVHYSIDVLGAYFMTGGIVVIGRYIFGRVEGWCDKMDEKNGI